MNGKNEHWIGIDMIDQNQKEKQIPNEFKKWQKILAKKVLLLLHQII